MVDHKLFRHSRSRLALWYALTMSAILNGMGWGMYAIISHFQAQTLRQEMASVAGTLHDQLEAKLTHAGQFNTTVLATLPGLCRATQPCAHPPLDPQRHVLGLSQQSRYYLVFWSGQGQPIGYLGVPPFVEFPPQDWQIMVATDGQRYQQHRVFLKTVTGAPWGYFVLGRSLQLEDQRLTMLRWLLLTGLPLGMTLIGFAGWHLAGRAMVPIYQSYVRMEQFTADAAHELRTPVAAIRATLEALATDPDPAPEVVAQTLNALQRQSHRLTDLVQDLLLLSRLDQTERLPMAERCCLTELISEVVNELVVLAIAGGIDLHWQEGMAPQLYVWGIPSQLSRVIRNLLQNALQYTPAGGQVEVTLHQQHQEAVFTVTDSGIGIVAADQEKIFDRFYRVARDRGRQQGGAGLGLAIAQAILHHHRGRIQVKSDLGQGSTFTVYLPLSTKTDPQFH
ncbi:MULTISPECIES: two-component system sensor histidine kinase RppB [unclassified Thermosynechococcus]|uniref:two-component system sensor histidine kinase RppB n=1 Tax=unclassified Thermosynechococcus TaxID=2622553 RepID=UPI00287325FC|nr:MULTISPECIES: two-component system sensor histidine kinase RppB [unclassified Thermosynechococcus]WNC22068.1 two-component system sensor histidine kinase RppB [Thermosynechococcus sp. PP22]WNC32307.1 two-component system sensor histidine kinase RppB [Thermosynechococcus sp. PKX95]WNC34836.1 two-component system sensor histidine kinase RppB [Thermosynechococcus sp. PKX91]WNC37352.1 two-component system sensor histidine kinase RppB [Thermosynechococcus sp. WL11]WNC39874.1 two-component system